MWVITFWANVVFSYVSYTDSRFFGDSAAYSLFIKFPILIPTFPDSVSCTEFLFSLTPCASIEYFTIVVFCAQENAIIEIYNFLIEERDKF